MNNAEQQQTKEAERYGTAWSWAEQLGIKADDMRKRLEAEPFVVGRDRGMRVREFSPNPWFAGAVAWGRELGVSWSPIKSRLGDAAGIDGRSSSGNVLRGAFFSETIIRERCADLLSDNHG